MRSLVPLALLCAAGAAAAAPAPSATSPAPADPAVAPTVYRPGAAPPQAVCRERIQEARELAGKPAEPGDASADPLFIAAVAKLIGGCSVLVMRNDTSDFRALPRPTEHRMMPAR